MSSYSYFCCLICCLIFCGFQMRRHFHSSKFQQISHKHSEYEFLKFEGQAAAGFSDSMKESKSVITSANLLFLQ
ncbi:CLUMA_CG016899, isoform A [Clunio marinus]|uniref:CLUMA_CG016899, isoform A n=1 Tax=Clunio marinus TaxID=568069 RepID=A0A1J1IVQ5_9DIPT|nr:CLUMA_CG016899, isoform A [Clunio marinus]